MYIDRGGANIGAEGLEVYIESENTMEETIEIVKAMKAPALLRAL